MLMECGVINERFQRSSTDLLKALSDTVGEDPTAVHYAFVDDPALTPTSRRDQFRYFMAKVPVWGRESKK